MVRIEPVPAWDGYVAEWLERGGAAWLSRGAGLYRAEHPGAQPVHVATVPSEAWKRVAARLRLGQRALRFSCYNLVPLEDGSLFVSFDRTIWHFADNSWRAVEGLKCPFRILRGGCAVARDGAVLFGEYFDNSERKEAVHVYRLAPGANRAEVVLTFEPGEIRHVHGIHLDPYSGDLWLCSGDVASECRVMRTADTFTTIEVVGAGHESWRAIQPIFTTDAIYYATDSEFAPNHIYRISRRDSTRAMVTEIDGPSYYGARSSVGPIFATTAELCPSQVHAKAVLWGVDRAGKAIEIMSYQKDLMAARALVRYFQAGIVQFPSFTSNQPIIPFTGSGLVGLDGRMFALVANEKGE